MIRRASSSGCQNYFYCEMLVVLVMASLLEKFRAGNFMTPNFINMVFMLLWTECFAL